MCIRGASSCSTGAVKWCIIPLAARLRPILSTKKSHELSELLAEESGTSLSSGIMRRLDHCAGCPSRKSCNQPLNSQLTRTSLAIQGGCWGDCTGIVESLQFCFIPSSWGFPLESPAERQPPGLRCPRLPQPCNMCAIGGRGRRPIESAPLPTAGGKRRWDPIPFGSTREELQKVSSRSLHRRFTLKSTKHLEEHRMSSLFTALFHQGNSPCLYQRPKKTSWKNKNTRFRLMITYLKLRRA